MSGDVDFHPGELLLRDGWHQSHGAVADVTFAAYHRALVREEDQDLGNRSEMTEMRLWAAQVVMTVPHPHGRRRAHVSCT